MKKEKKETARRSFREVTEVVLEACCETERDELDNFFYSM
jgi:hypothetical protein